MAADTPGDPPGQAPNRKPKELTPRAGAGSLALRGAYVFPVWWIIETAHGKRRCACPRGIDCPSPGKHPVANGWQDQATTNKDAIKAFFTAEPRINYGVFCGPSRWIVLDVDIRPDRDGMDAIRRLEDLMGEPLAITWHIQTGSGSHHFIYEVPDDYDWREHMAAAKLVSNLAMLGLGPGVDVKAGGGLVVGVGSRHISGKQYIPLGGEDGIVPWETPPEGRPTRIQAKLFELLCKPGRMATVADGKFGVVAESLLYKLAERAGLLRGHPTRSGMQPILCPWSQRAGHPGGHDEGSVTSTVLTGAAAGRRLGGIICHHVGKCPERTAHEMLALFEHGGDTRWPDGPLWIADADAALDVAGIEPLSTNFQRRPPEREAQVADADDVSWETIEQGPPPPPETTDMIMPALRAAGVRFEQNGAKKKQLRLINSTANLALFLNTHPTWQGAIARNLMTMQIEVRRELPPGTLTFPPVGETWEDPRHYASLADYFERLPWACKALSITPSSAIHKAVQSVAEAHRYSPLVEMITRLPTWDGTPRLKTWVHDVLAIDDPVAHRMGELWMLQAVARVLRPGCQADLVLILEGPQGIGKNTLVRAMNAPFQAVQLGSLEKTDEAVRRCHAGWIIELGEMAVMRRSEIEKIKNYITCGDDLLRRFYTEQMVRLPRRFVLIGTTNRADYLTDTTGNRRFLPLAIAGSINVAHFTEIRDQLYAEARERITAGEPWWPSGPEAADFGVLADARVPEPMWVDVLRKFFIMNPNITMITSQTLPDLLGEGCLNIPRERWNNAVRSQLSDTLRALGWVYSNHIGRSRSRDNPGTDARGWVRPDRIPGEDDDQGTIPF